MYKIFLWEKLKEREHLEELGIDGKICRMDLTEIGWGSGLEASGSGYENVAGSCEHGNEPSGCINVGELLD
jgi:hypothetical protein